MEEDYLKTCKVLHHYKFDYIWISDHKNWWSELKHPTKWFAIEWIVEYLELFSKWDLKEHPSCIAKSRCWFQVWDASVFPVVEGTCRVPVDDISKNDSNGQPVEENWFKHHTEHSGFPVNRNISLYSKASTEVHPLWDRTFLNTVRITGAKFAFSKFYFLLMCTNFGYKLMNCICVCVCV